MVARDAENVPIPRWVPVSDEDARAHMPSCWKSVPPPLETGCRTTCCSRAHRPRLEPAAPGVRRHVGSARRPWNATTMSFVGRYGAWRSGCPPHRPAVTPCRRRPRGAAGSPCRRPARWTPIRGRHHGPLVLALLGTTVQLGQRNDRDLQLLGEQLQRTRNSETSCWRDSTFLPELISCRYRDQLRSCCCLRRRHLA